MLSTTNEQRFCEEAFFRTKEEADYTDKIEYTRISLEIGVVQIKTFRITYCGFGLDYSICITYFINYCCNNDRFLAKVGKLQYYNGLRVSMYFVLRSNTLNHHDNNVAIDLQIL